MDEIFAVLISNIISPDASAFQQKYHGRCFSALP